MSAVVTTFDLDVTSRSYTDH